MIAFPIFVDKKKSNITKFNTAIESIKNKQESTKAQRLKTF